MDPTQQRAPGRGGEISLTHVRNVLIPAAALSAGYVWTVGQGGFESTNKNLCTLWAHLPLPAYQSCEFQYVLVIAWALVILVAAAWLFVSTVRLIGGILNRRKRLFAHWLLFAVFLLGAASSLYLLIGQYRNGQVASSSQTDPPFSKNVAGPPIEWRFDKPVTIFWYSRKPGEAVRIESIVINATNKSDFALKNVSATIVADMQEQKHAMRVNPHGTYIKPEESATLIPPRASFDLMLPIGTSGLSAEDFLTQYGTLKLSFQFEENGNKIGYYEQFSLSYIEDQIAYIEEKTRLPAKLDKKTENEGQETKAALGSTSAVVDLASIGLTPPENVIIADEIVVQSLAIVFLNLANSEGKESLFRRSWTALSNGRPIERKFSYHQFFVAIENKSTTKTLRSVRLVAELLSGPGGQVLNREFPCERTGTGSADIPPKGTDYYLIGEGTDGSDAGMFHPKIVASDEYDRILAEVEQREHQHIGFILSTSKGQRYSLLKNDGYRLTISAYADDTSPATGTLIINAKNRVQLWLTETTDV
jgi:hypothetical protein